MEQRISIITLGVADLDTSREFYERLGWQRSMAGLEGIVFFKQAGCPRLVSSRGTGKGCGYLSGWRWLPSSDTCLQRARSQRSRFRARRRRSAEPRFSSRHRKHSEEATLDTSPTRMVFYGRWPGIRSLLSTTMVVFDFPTRRTSRISSETGARREDEQREHAPATEG
jgi:hypothetical protein